MPANMGKGGVYRGKKDCWDYSDCRRGCCSGFSGFKRHDLPALDWSSRVDYSGCVVACDQKERKKEMNNKKRIVLIISVVAVAVLIGVLIKLFAPSLMQTIIDMHRIR
jgi:hypothetical protein